MVTCALPYNVKKKKRRKLCDFIAIFSLGLIYKAVHEPDTAGNLRGSSILYQSSCFLSCPKLTIATGSSRNWSLKEMQNQFECITTLDNV